MFDETHPLDRLTPASYNPRVITPEALKTLSQSIIRLGMLKPIIATASGKIVAGHQRTRTMLALGLTHTPAHVIDDVCDHDEVRFNQLHNASDLELVTAHLRVPAGLSVGWHVVSHADIDVVSRPEKVATQQAEVSRLLLKHGPWGAAVASTDGLIVVSAVYAHAVKLLRMPLHVRVIGPELVPAARHYFAQSYGAFSYRHLPKTTWVQSLAQMNRLRGQARGGRSTLYERVVIPLLEQHRGWRVLDFGSGHGDYARRLRRRRFHLVDVEFYRRKAGSMALDTRWVHGAIDRLCKELTTHGRFDLVVCDSVLNSTDSLQAEADVMTCLNAFVRRGGLVAFSGRAQTFCDQRQRSNYITSVRQRQVQFVDDQGFTAMFQRGSWLYQRFHTREQAQGLGARYIGPADYRLTKSSWQVLARQSVELEQADVEASLAREFDLPLPAGSYGRSSDILKAWRAAG